MDSARGRGRAGGHYLRRRAAGRSGGAHAGDSDAGGCGSGNGGCHVKKLLLHLVLAVIGGAGVHGYRNPLARTHPLEHGRAGRGVLCTHRPAGRVAGPPAAVAADAAGRGDRDLCWSCWWGWWSTAGSAGTCGTIRTCPLTSWGQVCLQFAVAWFFLSAAAVRLENALHRLAEWLAHRRGR